MNVFETVAKLTLDSKGYNEGLDNAQKQTEGFGSKVGSFLGGVGKAVATAATAAVSAAAGGIVAITKQAVDAYGNYEQLAGGVETLFGDSAQTVLENADKAFQNAGMSVNEYMETAIQSAASLINSLDGDQAKAAELMNTSITDMSDNVNKMGTTMEAVQNAYRGFSRGNFTMLDNLALGFAGTKEGMEQLLQKAEEISGVKYDISSYADIVEAIHVVQTEMGISGLTAEQAAEAVKNGTMTQEEAYNALGTTAKEANGTIQGSANQLKAAWSNLITNLGNEDADLDKLIDNVVEAGETVINNLKPVIEKAVKGIGTIVSEMAPVIKEVLPPLVEELAPSIIEVATSLVSVIIQALPQILSALVEQIPMIISTLISALGEAWPEISSAISQFLDTDVGKILEVVGAIVAGIKAYKIVGMVQGAISTISGLISGGTGIIATITSIINPVGLIVAAVVAAAVLIIANWDKIKAAWEEAKVFFGVLWECIKLAFADVKEWLAEKFISAWNAIKDAWSSVKDFFSGIWNGIKDVFDSIGDWFREKFTSAKDAVVNAWNSIGEKFSEIKSKITGVFENLPETFLSIGSNIVNGLWNGISNAWQWLKSKVEDLTEGLVGGLKSLLGINSPSKVFASIGDNLALGLGEGYEDAMVQVARDIQRISEDAIPTIDAPSVNQGLGSNGFYGGMRDIIINIDGSGLSVDEIAGELGSAVRREMRIAGAIG